eukprot:412126_1
MMDGNNEFDADKYLISFEEDVGCKISAVASTLQFQTTETKEKNWKTFSKGKDELHTFEELYTIVMGIINYTLKSKYITRKPSKDSIKALTITIISKLPKTYDNKPVLSQVEYMNNLHNLLNEIYDEIKDKIVTNVYTQTNVEMNIYSKPTEKQTSKYEVVQLDEYSDTETLQQKQQKSTKSKKKRSIQCNWVWMFLGFFGILGLGLMVFFSYMIYIGKTEMDTANEYTQSATKEQCTLISRFDTYKCSWNCKDGNGTKIPCSGKSCNRCNGYKYSFTAIAPSKCGNKTLTCDICERFDECSNIKKIIGNNYSCHVMECDKQTFSLHTPKDYNERGITYIVIFSILLAIGFCCFLPVAINYCLEKIC